MTVTITDISKKLGLSVSTVSKALNNYPDVSDRTRVLVHKTATEMGYYPSAAARTLRSGRTGKVGFLINDSVTFVADYLAAVIPGLILVAEKSECALVMYTTSNSRPDALIRICRSHEVDGLILFISDGIDRTINLLLDEQFPFVVMSRRVENPIVSYVAPDNRKGAYEATQHLIDCGHRRIGFMTRPALGTTSIDRFDGYRQALQDAGIEYNEELIIQTRIETLSGYNAMQTLLDLDEPPTAVFASHDMVALDALQAARDRHFRVPEDVAIVGFDGLQSSMITTPPITTVRPPLEAIGQRAMEVLLEQIASGDEAAPVRETYAVELIIRESTARQDTMKANLNQDAIQ